MNGFKPLAALAVISLLMAGCEGQLRSENKEQSLLAGPVVTTRPATASGEAEARGETAAVYGDDQTAVKLFERSYDEHPTVENAFNLAAAYARTGRPKEAILRYRQVVETGTLKTGITESTIHSNGHETTFNYRDEAQKRLVALEASITPGEHDAKPLSDAEAAHADDVRQPN